VVVDLGAAPGGWSQVAANKGSKVVAVDLIDIDAIRGVESIQGNFLQHEIKKRVEVLTGGKGVDTVLSDMMASMTGVRDRDVQASLDLVSAATSFGIQTLKHGTQSEGEGEQAIDGRGAKVYTGGNMV
jgi:23S rRNA (uridine2552-2'-O)-methyltransferase